MLVSLSGSGKFKLIYALAFHISITSSAEIVYGSYTLPSTNGVTVNCSVTIGAGGAVFNSAPSDAINSGGTTTFVSNGTNIVGTIGYTNKAVLAADTNSTTNNATNYVNLAITTAGVYIVWGF